MVFSAVGMAVMAIVLFLWLVIGQRPGAKSWFSRKWIGDQDAPITAELKSEVEQARWRLGVGGLLGGLINFLILIPVMAHLGYDDRDMVIHSAVGLLPFMLMFVGWGVGGVVAVIREVRGPVRVASPQAARLRDFVHPLGLVLMRLELAILLGGGVAATQYPRWTGTSFDPFAFGVLWAVIVAVALVWAAAELIAHRLIASPQPSADALSLFWRDALRSGYLRVIFWAACVLGWTAPSAITSTLPRSWGTPAAGIGPQLVSNLSLTMLVLTYAALFALILKPRTRRHKAMHRAAQLEYGHV